MSDLTKDSKQMSSNQWNGAHIKEFDNMVNKILLDNQSTTSIFCNPNLVSNIRETDETLNLRTNAGILQTNLKAHVDNWGDVWFSPAAMTNIFSYTEMANRYRITADTAKENAILVHCPNKIVKFTRNQSGLHELTPKITRTNEEHWQFVNTLEENKSFYTPRQFERAKQARELYHAIGTQSISDFKAALSLNLEGISDLNF